MKVDRFVHKNNNNCATRLVQFLKDHKIGIGRSRDIIMLLFWLTHVLSVALRWFIQLLSGVNLSCYS